MEFVHIVFRNLMGRRVRSALTVFGTALAVGVMVSLVGIAEGLKDSYGGIFRARGVDMVVTRAGSVDRYRTTLPQFIGEEIRRLPGVAAVSPALIDIVSFEESNVPLAPVQGWAPDSFAFDNVTLVEGARMAPGETRGAIVGEVLARNLGKRTGDVVRLMEEDFRVTGVFESPVAFENGTLVVLLEDLQTISGRTDQVTGFQVVLVESNEKDADMLRVRAGVESLRDARGREQHLVALPIRDHVADMNQLRLAEAVAWATSLVALLLGTVGVFNVMMMSVFERTQEIGILRAIGWRRQRVMRMFLLESVLLGLCGAAVGSAGAVAFTYALNAVPSLNGYVTAGVAPLVVAEGFAISILVGVCGGILPALRATWVQPTEALRHV